MAYYDWDKILKSYKDIELKRIYKDINREPLDKIEAAKKELIHRGLLSSDNGEFIQKKIIHEILPLEEIAEKTNSNKTISQICLISMSSMLALLIIGLYLYIIQYDLIIKIQEGELISTDKVEAYESIISIITISTFVFYIINSIIFIIWFYKSYFTLQKRIKTLEHDSSWTVVGWIIPIISLYRPFNLMAELDKKLDIILKDRNSEFKSNSLIGLWWFLFICVMYIGNIVSKFGGDGRSFESILNILTTSIVLTTLTIILGLVTIKMIRSISMKDELLYKYEANYRINSHA